MGCFDESLEVVRPAVVRVRSITESSVIAPVPSAAESADRHDLDRGDAEGRKMIQFLCGSRERALRGKSADVELVKHDVVPLPTLPGFPPSIGAGIDGLAGTIDALRLRTGRRVGNLSAVRQRKPVTRSCGQSLDEGLVKAVRATRHGDGAAPLDHQLNPFFAWRPQPKRYPAFAERRAMCPPHTAVSQFDGRNLTSWSRM